MSERWVWKFDLLVIPAVLIAYHLWGWWGVILVGLLKGEVAIRR